MFGRHFAVSLGLLFGARRSADSRGSLTLRKDDRNRKCYSRYLLVVAGLGGLLYGIDLGIIGGALPYLEATSGLTAGQLSAVVAAVLMGSVFSTLFAGLLSEWFGRRSLMIASGTAFSLSIPVIALSSGFAFLIAGRILQGISGGIIGVVVPADSNATRAVDRRPAKTIILLLRNDENSMLVEWRAILRDDSAYFRKEIAISARQEDLLIRDVRLFDGRIPGAKVVGTVKGSPVAAENIFLGFENPLAKCAAGVEVVCSMHRELPSSPEELLASPIESKELIWPIRMTMTRL